MNEFMSDCILGRDSVSAQMPAFMSVEMSSVSKYFGAIAIRNEQRPKLKIRI